MERFIGLLGICAILGIAYLLSNDRKNIDLRVIIWGLGLQLLFESSSEHCHSDGLGWLQGSCRKIMTNKLGSANPNRIPKKARSKIKLVALAPNKLPKPKFVSLFL